MCAGEFEAVELTTAAGWPPILTVCTNPPSIVPEKTCGSGVGTGPPGDGLHAASLDVDRHVAGQFEMNRRRVAVDLQCEVGLRGARRQRENELTFGMLRRVAVGIVETSDDHRRVDVAVHENDDDEIV